MRSQMVRLSLVGWLMVISALVVWSFPTDVAAQPNSQPTILGTGGALLLTPTAMPTIFPDIELSQTAFNEIHANGAGTTTNTLTINNLGEAALVWEVAQDTPSPPALIDVKTTIPPPMRHPKLVSAGTAMLPTRFYSAAALPRAWFGTVELALDDGTAEDTAGISEWGQLIWFNRFTPNSADFPFTLSEIQMQTTSLSGCSVSDIVDFYVYQDADGDPANGATFVDSLLSQEVGTLDQFNSYPANIALTTPGDVLILAVNRTCTATLTFPAALDNTTSQQRSWVGYYGGTVDNPPVLPAPQFYNTIDALGLPGNWTLRGVGETQNSACSNPANLPWLTVTPMNGTTNGHSASSVTLSYDSTGLAVGDYSGTLCLSSNDPDEPMVMLPITLTLQIPTAVDIGTFTVPPTGGFSILTIGIVSLLMLSGVTLLLRRK